ncbi:MAG: nucleoside triphosphate pyrophosphatase [Alphaproteobacteria bacterium]|jgi:septum formation protein|nr:septum formation protein Maf [Rhodospirillaceae bacterium]MDP6485384.1 nucleoside triphosphate pyrophosphatase [Alphaproteobacteria bacterium]MDP6660397.1 nucleoside triphosphate pyrophosphatase [Alphaproteobacteria bacterium]MDP6781683.1 nucleoside triphosphate pyrophosphatase [Alphaproteobacteria bacterium]MDP7045401.1 nucleoside triphosphate pyrophosphatase [Alphaproteobacteria bacterium]|tara:strand:+ start:800 stop:1408 length:609 start_codon:yes stop_codon:yes gene_type:complete
MAVSTPVAKTRLILASASPRRLDLLKQIGIHPDEVDPPHIDESPLGNEKPADHALRLAREKAETVHARHQGCFILAADTVVTCGRRILPKAGDTAQARECLELLSGRRHRVIGSVCIIDPEGRSHILRVTTTVAFKRLTRDETASYLESGEWRGKAGGYAIQGRAQALVRFINGSYSNVVGLPLFETRALLEGLGYTTQDAP